MNDLLVVGAAAGCLLPDAIEIVGEWWSRREKGLSDRDIERIAEKINEQGVNVTSISGDCAALNLEAEVKLWRAVDTHEFGPHRICTRCGAMLKEALMNQNITCQEWQQKNRVGRACTAAMSGVYRPGEF